MYSAQTSDPSINPPRSTTQNAAGSEFAYHGVASITASRSLELEPVRCCFYRHNRVQFANIFRHREIENGRAPSMAREATRYVPIPR